MKKFISLVLVLMLALTITACGGSGGSDESAGSEDGQNSVMNFIGTYVCGRASVVISAEGNEGASAIVSWSSSAFEHSTWVMSGTFDAGKLVFEYDNCVRTDYVYESEDDEGTPTEVYNDGHGTMTFTDGDPITMVWQDDKEDIAKDMVFEYVLVMDPQVGMANPWSTADSLAAAAEGAGIGSFDLAEGSEISLGKVDVTAYRYMDGIAEAVVEFPAVEMTIRKGTLDNAPDGDISGDYTGYEHTWTQNIKGLEVTCFGNREGDATKTIWATDDAAYSINVLGLGGDTDYGLSADDLNSLINGIQ